MDSDLTQAPLMAALSDAQLARVRAHATRLDLAEGEWLFSQDDAATRFYFVGSGQMRLFRSSADGDEKVIELVSAGQTFAEALMFMGTGRYPVCAAALSPVRLIAIDATDFVAMLRESPETSFALLGDLSRRLHGLIAEIDSLTLVSATGRVARWLLARLPPADRAADQTENGRALALDVRKSVLASRLSIKPETWSRITRRLSEDGIITVDGQRIAVLDRAALQVLADEAGTA
ncbi:MAG: Crp/Fnr family transcriptional regulator [Thiohalocapsa sp.]